MSGPEHHSSWLPVLVAIGLFIAVVAVAVMAFVPTVDCPGCGFMGAYPPYVCVHCGDTLRVTMFKKWRLGGGHKPVPLKDELILWPSVRE